MSGKIKKIAQIVCVLPPYGGGIGMVAHSYADQLFERGKVSVAFSAHTRRYRSEDKRYQVKYLFTPLKFGHAAFLPQLLWRLRDFDLVHLHYPYFGASLWPALLKKIKGRKMKFFVSYHMDFEAGGWRGVIYKISRALFEKFILRQADKIICSSEDYLENSNIQEYYFQHINQFVELPFGVPRFFHPESKDQELLKRYGFSSSDKVILFVGGLDSAHYFKGVNYLIKSFTYLPDKNIKCLIVGSGNLKDNYKKQVKELNLEGRVKFSGYVPSAELAKHYNLADLVVLPSINRGEAFGIVLLEAMACGKPLLASNLKGVRTVVELGVNGLLVEPKNSRDLADKINCFIDNPEMMKTFSANGLRLVEEKYRWSKIVNDLLALYEKA